MDHKNEKSLAAPMALGDEALTAVAGGHGYGYGRRRCHRPHRRPSYGTSVTQSNTVGDITLNADDNSGTVSLSLTQSNSVG